jgi:hypothetical protein
MTDLDALLREYVERLESGEVPAALDFIRRAGDSAVEMALMIESVSTPRLPPPGGAGARIEQRLQRAGSQTETFAALLVSSRAGRSRAAIARELAADLDAPAQRAVVKAHLADLEHGRADPRRLAPEVLTALARILGAPRERLEAARRRATVSLGPTSAATFARRAPEGTPGAEPRAGPADPDRERIDELFLGSM